MSIHQISIFLENRAGSLSEVTKLLAESGVNLRALSIAESADYGVLRIIADDTKKAEKALLEKDCVISLTPISVVSVPDKPSGLSDLLLLLAEEKVDIEYMYSLFTHGDGHAYMVFRLKDAEGFRKVVESHNLTIASPEELGLK